MNIAATAHANAGILDDFAARLATASDAAPATDSFLDAYRSIGVPVRLTHSDLADLSPLGPMHDTWHDMHEAVRGAITSMGQRPAVDTSGVSGAAGLMQRLASTERHMSRLETYPSHDADVAAIAFGIRSTLDDLAGPARLRVEDEARQLREAAGRLAT